MDRIKKLRRVKRNLDAEPPFHPFDDGDLFVGLDVSLSDTGVAIIDRERNLIKLFSIKTNPKKMQDDTRVAYTADTVMNIIEEYSGNHKVRVCYEKIPFTKRPTGKAFTRTEMVGVIKYRLRKAGLDAYGITTTTMKKRFAGIGSADKVAVMRVCREVYGHDIRNDNVADGFACASLLIDYIDKKIKLTIDKLPMEN